jgi:hypothetical protein
MLIPSFKRLDKQNFDPKYSDLIDQLGLLLNTQLQAYYNALSGNLSLTDNIDCTIKTISIVVDATGKPLQAAQVQLNDSTMRPYGCQVINAVNTTNSNTYPTGQPFVSFTPGTQMITINNVTGLQANQNYTLTLVIWAQ